LGINTAIFAETEAPYYYKNAAPIRLELEECIHFHSDNFRFIWTVEEFKKIFPLFLESYNKLKEQGFPNKSEYMQLLSGLKLDTSSLQHNRWAVELTEGGLIHIHIGNLRIHLPQIDFEALANFFKEALVEFYTFVSKEIDLRKDNIVFPAHVQNEYLPLLEKYNQGLFCKINAVDVGRLKSNIKWYIRNATPESYTTAGIQRDMSKPFLFTHGIVPKNVDREYLFAIYESIKEWGYADGPFYGEYIHCIQLENKIQVMSAHRVAALLSLGCEKIPVFLTLPRNK
jgi:hypothetical protein